MIRDLSETLQAILDDPALGASFPELARAQVAFERPAEQFNPSQTTINLFLFDIRENTALRSKEPIVERKNGQALLVQPPKRVDCSYLVTAWAAEGTGPQLVLEEHELLGQALQVLARYPTIPDKFLQGGLKKQELPPPLNVGGTNAGEVKDPADFWSALGNRLRPALVVTVTVELRTVEPKKVWIAKAHDLRLALLSQAGAKKAAVEKPAPVKRTAAAKSAVKSSEKASKKSSKTSVRQTAVKSAKKSTAKKSSAKR